MLTEDGERIAAEETVIRDGSILGVPASVLLHFSIDHEIPTVGHDEFQKAVSNMTPDQQAALNGMLQSDELTGVMGSGLRARLCSAATFLHQLELATITNNKFNAITAAVNKPYQPSLFEFAA